MQIQPFYAVFPFPCVYERPPHVLAAPCDPHNIPAPDRGESLRESARLQRRRGGTFFTRQKKTCVFKAYMGNSMPKTVKKDQKKGGESQAGGKTIGNT